MLRLALLALCMSAQAFAYVDMSDVPSRAADLNMSVNDYAFAMALTGTLSGSLLGLFIWKAK